MSLNISSLEKVRASGGKTVARCPACAEEGNDRSGDHLFINADGAFGCVRHQGCEGDAHRRRVFELAGIRETKPAVEKSIWTALPFAPETAPAPVLTHHELGKPSCHWTYRTREGRTAAIVVRFETAKGKETRPLTWCRDQHGGTAWRWKGPPDPRTIYGLPFTEDFVVIVEGEKCAEAIRSAGLPATTWLGGASAVAKSDWSPVAGKVAVIWPDNDEPGSRAKDALIVALGGIASQIKVVAIPQGKPPKWDCADTGTADIFRLVDEAVEIETAAAPAEETASASKPFTFFRADQLTGQAESMDFVEGLLTKGGASVIYGPSNCGKSFWIMDLAAAVATGRPFRDELEVEQGAVVYVALEGSYGARNRVEALKQAGTLKPDTPFYLVFESISLLENGHAARLAETVAAVAENAGRKVRLVILDTMARAMAGGDENSGQDMTAAVQSIDAVRAATGAHVAVIHHCGKDEARGARGHSSLRAAVDTEIGVSRAEGETISTVKVTKQRDLQIGGAMPFSLKIIELGTDRRGKPVTSCVVHHEDEIMAAKPGKAGRKPTCTPEEMLRFLPAVSVTEWQQRVKEETGLSASSFYSLKKHLEAGNRIRKTPTGFQVA
jgi:hypothetical protein